MKDLRRKNISGSKGKRKLKIVEVSGNPYEMGFQYDTACPEISEMLDMTCQLFGGPDKAKALIKKYVTIYLPAIEKYGPEIVEEMKGIAAGSCG